MSSTRRQFLATAGSFALMVAGKGSAGAAMGPNDKFDLVIKGGDLLDPSQSLRGRLPYLTWVMSKFMGLGFSLEQVVAMATTKPAAVINRTPKLGSLQVGAPGDVAIIDVVEGPVSFVDTRNNKREGKVHLKPVQTVAAGVPFGRPYNAPFAVR